MKHPDMAHSHTPQTSDDDQPILNSDRLSTYPCPEQASDSAQIMTHLLHSIESPENRLSEKECQSQVCLPHLKDSQAQIAAFKVASPPAVEAQGLSEEQSKETANQSPSVERYPERQTNVAPDEIARLDDAATVAPAPRRQLRVQPRVKPTAYPWQGVVQAPAPTLTRPLAKTPTPQARTVRPSPIDVRLQPDFQTDAFQRSAFQKAERAVSRRIAPLPLPEPALHPTTYQLPLRSKEVKFANAIVCSFPRLVMLFLLGIAIAYASGLAFPEYVSWLVLSSILSGLLRGLGLAILVSLAIAFVLEFR